MAIIETVYADEYGHNPQSALYAFLRRRTPHDGVAAKPPYLDQETGELRDLDKFRIEQKINISNGRSVFEIHDIEGGLNG